MRGNLERSDDVRPGRLGDRHLEARLREQVPDWSPRLEILARRLEAERRPRHAALAFTVALTATIVAALMASGGFSYAAELAKQAVERATKPSSPRTTYATLALNAGGDQYRPGYGWGDPRHNHTGPPGLKRVRSTRVTAKPVAGGKAVVVVARVLVDEQASLSISVLNPDGVALLLSQSGSTVGTRLSGPQSKVIRYQLLVPRVVAFRVRIPANLLTKPGVYVLRIIAVDVTGRRTEFRVGFRPPEASTT